MKGVSPTCIGASVLASVSRMSVITSNVYTYSTSKTKLPQTEKTFSSNFTV